ncbi:MAG: primosomal protein DnaI [Bacilli bacterium]|nr:primosomal protein DnaI [Bacilli bacterium]MDD4608418.1 primosomal protein DnaI [Bacilli bacterium]
MKKLNNELNVFKVNPNSKYNLEHEFDLACKNEDFKNFIGKLKLPKTELMKYTSLIEESMSEYNNCLDCKNIMECKNKVRGHAYLPKVENGKLKFNYKACRYQEKLTKENKYQKYVTLFKVPKDIKTASMKNIYTKDENRFEVVAWIKNFISNYNVNDKQKGLYLHGNFGCGKTYLIAAMFNELAKSNVKSAIIFWPEYLRELKASFGRDFDSKFNNIKNVPLLLIDDIGAENSTAWARDEILCTILQYRMDDGLPTFFTSNLDIKSLEKHLSITKDSVDVVKARRIIERISQLTDNIEMISENLRK